MFDEGKGLSTKEQQYDPTSIINEVRGHVDAWRALSPSQWQVTPETARLLQHWRHHKFSGVRPFFCQVEAAETAIWLTEVAPQSTRGKRVLDHLAAANKDANPELMRLALKLATGAGKTTVMAMLIAWRSLAGCGMKKYLPTHWIFLDGEKTFSWAILRRALAQAKIEKTLAKNGHAPRYPSPFQQDCSSDHVSV